MQSCDSATPAIPKIKSKKIYFNSFIQNLQSCDSAIPAIPKIVTQKIFPLYLNCNPATLRLLRFQNLRAKKIFQSIYTESAILRLCDSCDSKN